MSKLTPSIGVRLSDPDADRVRQNTDRQISELQKSPLAGARIISNVQLADATNVPVAHGLGRPPLIVLVSPPRSPSSSGRITEVRLSTHDRNQVVLLRANGWGSTVTVDVLVA